MPRGHRTTARSILALLLLWALTGTAHADVPERILFPVVGKVTYTDDFGAPRGSGPHQGNDIMAPRGAPVVAVEAGRVSLYRGSSAAGCMLYLYGRSKTTYYYIHLNNDLTRSNDNRASDCRSGVAYAPGLRDGQRVSAGQLVGFVGDSGDADGGNPHLHFELHPDGRRAVSPYRWLTDARKLLYAVPQAMSPIRLALSGTVTSTEDSFSLRIRRVAVSRGWRGPSPARTVSLAYAPQVVVQRRGEAGSLAASSVRSVERGERVTVWTTWFAPTLATKLAPPGALTAELIRLRAAK